MAQTLKFGNKTWATKVGSTLAYNDENGNYKPLPFAFTRSTSATRVNKEGLIEVVTNDRPRIDYTDTSDGVLLLEKAATNLVTYSEDFSQWSKINGVVVTDNFTISPDGTQNASKFDFNGTNIGRVELTVVTSGTNTQSVYLKTENGTQKVSIGPGSSNLTEFTVTDQWVRYTHTGSGNFPRILCNDDASIYCWGCQYESGDTASSYIPTQGSASTRVAETASGAGNSEVFSDSQGVLFANISQDNDSFNTISVSDGGTTDRVTMVYQNNTIKSILVHNNNVVVLEKSGYLQNLFHKVAIKYTSSNVSLIVNGFELFTASRGAFADSLNTLQFAQGNGGNNFYGKTKEIGYYTVLTDLELETLTSYKSWTSMVNELNLNIIYNG